MNADSLPHPDSGTVQIRAVWPRPWPVNDFEYKKVILITIQRNSACFNA